MILSFRKVVLVALSIVAAAAADKDTKAVKTAVPKPPAGGIKTPGVLIPAIQLKAEATLELASPPSGLQFSADAVAVADQSAIKRFDLKSNKAFEPSRDVNEVKTACGGFASGFGAVWTATCGSQPSLAKVELPASPMRGGGGGGMGRGGNRTPDSAKPPATAENAPQEKKEAPPAPPRREAPPAKPKPPAFTAIESAPSAKSAIAASSDSLWLLADSKTSLQRIDPQSSAVVADIRLPVACESIVFAENSLWVACPSQPKLLRVDPATNLVDKRIDVAAEPISITAGEGSIWVLGRKEGKISRVDPKANKVIATIDLGLTAVNGTLAFGEGSVWASTPGFPVIRISPATDKVVQQFYGEGGGRIAFGAGSVWVADVSSNSLRRFDPKRIQATLAE